MNYLGVLALCAVMLILAIALLKSVNGPKNSLPDFEQMFQRELRTRVIAWIHQLPVQGEWGKAVHAAELRKLVVGKFIDARSWSDLSTSNACLEALAYFPHLPIDAEWWIDAKLLELGPDALVRKILATVHERFLLNSESKTD